MTGVPATSPGSTGSGSNLSPSCGGEPGPALSPLSSSRAGSGMAGDPMAGQGILSDSSHLAALSGQPILLQILSLHGNQPYAIKTSDLRPDLSPRVSGYSRLGGSMSSLGPSMYPGSYPTSEQNPYPSIAMDNSAFYGSLVS